ncbi:MAG: MFS transporter [Candidatus Aminicenantes bacterium]|nr:MFS transporter [Candidatus Aminicenantes bacterium]
MMDKKEKAHFPKTFWTANTIELFERAAYYSMASFMVIYLKETLGMAPTFATFLNGSLLWGLIYFMPIVSGTLADKYGFKRSLTVSFLMLFLGYFIMGNVQKFWPAIAGGGPHLNYTIPVLLAIILIGLGGSIVKPCIAGTVQKTSGVYATLGFGIFYMVINIGSITGRGVSYFIRTSLGIPAIFTYASTVFVFIGLLVVLFIYREPEYASNGVKDNQQVRKKTLKESILGIFIVLSNLKFVFFLIVIALFWFLYVQLYNLIPLFLRHIDPNAPVELYTLANPLMIVCFQLLITRLVKSWTPVKSILFGVGVTTVGMLLNILPALLYSNLSQKVSVAGLAIPIAGLFLLVSIASMAVGEMMASPRIYEYIGSIAPKGEEGLYLGYANLPVAIGSILGGPLGGALYQKYIANPLQAGQSPDYIIIWTTIAFLGLCSMAGLAIYDRFVVKTKKPA